MRAVIRFHLDENVDHAVAHGLRLRGVDVTTSTDANLIGAPDEAQIAFAVAANRVVFTQDQDFLAHHHRGAQHAGIVYCRKNTRVLPVSVQRAGGRSLALVASARF